MQRVGRIGEERIFDSGWSFQRVDNVHTAFFHGRMTEASFERFYAVGMGSIDDVDDTERVAVLHEVRDPVLMNGRWRGKISRGLKERKAKLALTRCAYAMVTQSLVARVALKAMHWFAPPPYPYTIVSSVEEACAFIAKHLPGVDGAELARQHASLRDEALRRASE